MKATRLVCGLIILCLISSSLSQEAKEFECKPSYYAKYDCNLKLPFCQTYKVKQGPFSRYLVSCSQCMPGFTSLGEVDVLNIDQSTNLPDNELKVCALQTDFTGSFYVSTMNRYLSQIFPNCLRVSFSGASTAADGTSSAEFKCEQCGYMYTPSTDVRFTKGRLESGAVFGVCKRAELTFDCGHLCQLEFPGCARVQVSKTKQKTFNSKYTEEAQFYCLEALPGYEAIFQYSTLKSISTTDAKTLVLPQFQSNAITGCDKDMVCRFSLPNCKSYFTSDSPIDHEIVYNCLECKAGFKPISPGISSIHSIGDMYTELAPIELCEPLEVRNMQTSVDPDFVVEYPNCLEFSRTNVKKVTGTDKWKADFKCNRCKDGFVPVTTEEDLTLPMLTSIVDLGPNFKILCIPPTDDTLRDCDENCRKDLPRCRKYKNVPMEGSPAATDTYQCVECDPGFEPVNEDYNYISWLYAGDKVVCRKGPTPGPVECPEVCKEMFPACDLISIEEDDQRKMTYTCSKCSDGYFPIPYNKEKPGRLTKDDQVRVMFSSKIPLCSKKQNFIYKVVEYCDLEDRGKSTGLFCELGRNCKRPVLAMNLDTYINDRFCLECIDSYEPISQPLDLYSRDLSLCKPIPKAPKAQRGFLQDLLDE